MSDKARRKGAPLYEAQVRNFLDTLSDYGCKDGRWTLSPTAVKELSEAWLERDLLRDQVRVLREALHGCVLILTPMDSLRHIDPEFPALDKARAALAQTEPKP